MKDRRARPAARAHAAPFRPPPAARPTARSYRSGARIRRTLASRRAPRSSARGSAGPALAASAASIASMTGSDTPRALQCHERSRRHVEVDRVGADHGDDRRVAEPRPRHLLNVRVADRGGSANRCRRLGRDGDVLRGGLGDHGRRRQEWRLGFRRRKAVARRQRQLLERLRRLGQRFGLRARSACTAQNASSLPIFAVAWIRLAAQLYP